MSQQNEVTQDNVDQWIQWMQQHLPRFQVCFKDESRLQRLIGWLLWPINRTYMTEYTTVMFGKIYFPSREEIESWGPAQVYAILRHEFVHLMDAKRFPVWFELSYLLLFPAGLTLRAYWEWRGYTQTLLVEHELYGTISDDIQEHILRRFVNSEYGWMFPFPNWLRRKMRKLCQSIEAGEVTGPYPYKEWGRETPPLRGV
ncbi:MAG: hypothetical protein EP343_13395 [Deltaproteobacteria bacterium]|nr:MAG: hypothetical protein EP343_13395 [Deltaproteobacteria bacterium]